MNKLFFPDCFRLISLGFAMTAGLMLSGCATVQSTSQISQTQTQNWALQGKIGMKTPEQTGSASLYWQQQGDFYHIRLFGPLGIGAVELNGKSDQVTYRDNQGKVYQADSAEVLLKKNTGWQIPVNNLRYWIRALPAPHMPSEKSYDAQHQLVSLQQQGWKIDYLRYQHRIPSLIQLIRPEINLRIVINQFQYFN